MFKSEYEAHLMDRESDAKDSERKAFDHSIQLLYAAQAEGTDSAAAVEAIYFTQRLWTLLLEDLASTENALPKELRAQIISVGIWILRECEKQRGERSPNFDELILVSETIRNGIR
jgi:flagellar protein FlaF